MKAPEQLPLELVWTAEGHLSEVAMTAIADGEEAILPRDAFGHIGLCDACATGVESAASLSTTVGEALALPLESQEEAPVRLVFPVWGAVLAVAVAAVAMIPNLHSLKTWMAHLTWGLSEGAPLLTRHVAALLPRALAWLPVMSLTAATLLLLAGFSVARLAPRAIER